MNIHLIEEIKMFTKENILIFNEIISKLKSEDLDLSNFNIDNQLIDKIFKFAPLRHILENNRKSENEILELFYEVKRDLKNYELELRIEELESKFSKDMSESTFNEIKELKKKQNIN